MSRETNIRLFAFSLGCMVTSLIFSVTIVKKMFDITNQIGNGHVSPLVRDKFESKMRGGFYLMLKRDFESMSPEEQKEIEDGLNDPEVRKIMDQMFKKGAEMIRQTE